MSAIMEGCEESGFDFRAADFRGDFDGEPQDSRRQMERMLAMVHAKGAPAILDVCFPQDHIAGHTRRAAYEAKDFYRNPEVLRIAMCWLRRDYEKFGLPVPAYARAALSEG